MTGNDGVSLLVDGGEAFERILERIGQARFSIRINMFIWRDDKIGRQIARAVLQAAQRGVQVDISVDRVGMVLEMCEEEERSFFHEKPGLGEWIKILGLRFAYPQNREKNKGDREDPGLARQLLGHKNIRVDRARQKADHSKFYVFDDEILIFGGVNIEEKERSGDCLGRIYQDYMIEMKGKGHVKAFLDKLERGLDSGKGYRFLMNNKRLSPPAFEMEEGFLRIIEEAREELVIVMAYFAPMRNIMDAIVRAWKRGVRIRMLIPRRANFQNDCNRKTARAILKATRNGVTLALSPKMVHTKLIYNENTVMVGSSNITANAFTLLGELDIQLKNDQSPLVCRLKKSVEENFALCERASHFSRIEYNRFIAWIEGRFN